MHAWTICNKKLDKEFPVFKKIVRDTSHDCRSEAVRRHMVFATFMHSMNLLRWYGDIRNRGEYNKDCVFDVFENIIKVHEEQKVVKAKFKALGYPTVAQLKKHLCMHHSQEYKYGKASAKSRSKVNHKKTASNAFLDER